MPTNPDQGNPPSGDGSINTYLSGEGTSSSRFDRSRVVIFVNGMGNSPNDHRESALALSLLQMCPVIGVYNRSAGFFADLGQCIADKYQFDGPAARDPRAALDRAMGIAKSRPGGAAATRESVMIGVLERNPAAASLFRLLRKPEHRRTPIFAHSQGNLITSNTLSAIVAVDGSDAMIGRDVYTFGSPAMNWPAGVRTIECGFTWDPVTWLAGFDTSFTISKVGMPSGSLNPITHSFLEYLRHDPAFVVNRFRWGSLGVTVSMDEEGLARCLFEMGQNFERVRKIFDHLNRHHNSDADDVALEYVRLIRAAGDAGPLATAVRRDPPLRDLLIKVMDEGWTSDDEKKAIAFLRS